MSLTETAVSRGPETETSVRFAEETRACWMSTLTLHLQSQHNQQNKTTETKSVMLRSPHGYFGFAGVLNRRVLIAERLRAYRG